MMSTVVKKVRQIATRSRSALENHTSKREHEGETSNVRKKHRNARKTDVHTEKESENPGGRDDVQEEPSAEKQRTEQPADIATVNEDINHQVVYDEIPYQDMNGKSRRLSLELASFIVPFPDTTPPPSLINFVALYTIRNEARRIFPREVSVSWLMDMFASTWIQKSKDQQPSKDGDEAISFPLSEHDRLSFFPLLKKRYLLFPFFTNSSYSLIAIESLGAIVDFLTTFMELEATASKTTALDNDSRTLLQRINRFEKALPLKKIQASTIFHIDWLGSSHEEFRPGIHNFVLQLCFYLVDGLKSSCSPEALSALLNEHVLLHVRYIPDPPENVHDSAWKLIQYVMVMAHGPGFDPETGKPTICERENLLYGSLKSSSYADQRILRKVADMAMVNMQTAKENPEINPYPGLWGGVLDSLTRDINEPLLISSSINLCNCLPVVLEFSLKALDDFAEQNKSLLSERMRADGFEKTLESQDLTEEMKDLLFSASLREKACHELLPQFQRFVRITRPGKKSKGRLARFWKSVFDHVMTLPQYREASSVFSAMRKFPDSVTVCLGLDYLHSKEHRLFFYQALTPNLRQGERPWKLFDHSSKNFSRTSQWFERGAWGRMHEAGVILFAFTETIMRCVVSRAVKTETELVSLLKATRLANEEALLSIVSYPVHLRDVVHHERQKRESLENYRKRVVDRIEDAAEAARITLACASDAFKRALVPFGSAYGVKRGVKGLNIALCKLRTVPDNMLDLLWQNVTGILKETLLSREKKREFSFNSDGDQLGMEIEAQLIRLFRLMNTIFADTADSFLKDKFLASRERLRRDVASFESKEGSGKRLRKLQAIPSFVLWNYVDTRYSSGYMNSATMNVSPVVNDVIQIEACESERATERQTDISPLQALSLQGITSPTSAMPFMKRDSLAMLPDTNLAMQVEPIPLVALSKANFGWGLVTALGCILQKIPGHTRTHSCRSGQRAFCSPSSQPSNACTDLVNKIAQHVFSTWADGYGAESLQSQSVFTRFDAVVSAVLQVTSCSEFWCRPSIDASLCHERHLRYESRDERDAFVGYESNIAIANGDFNYTKWRAVVAKAQIQKLPYPIRRMHVDTTSQDSNAGKPKVNAVDFLNLSAFDLRSPDVYKVDLRYLLQTPDVCGQRLYERQGELRFQPGDVFWFSMLISGPVSDNSFTGRQGYSGTHLGVMMEPATTVVDKQSERWAGEDAASVAKEQVAAILFLSQQGNDQERHGFEHLLGRLSRDLRVFVVAPGNKVIQLIPTGINIQNELITYHVTFRRNHLLPRAVNLASVHSRLLQMHTQFVLTTLHRHTTAFDRRKALSSGESQQQIYERMRQQICGVLVELYPRLNLEQLKAITIPLLWALIVEQSFFTKAGKPASSTRLFSSTLSERDMHYIGCNMFFVRGPPGTGKSYVISALIDAAMSGHKREKDAQKFLPTKLKRVLVVTHTNTAVDDILVKITKTRSYKEGEVIRVGVRGKDPRTTKFTVCDILNRLISRQREEMRKRGGRGFKLNNYTELGIIQDASIVCSTFGSLQRPEFRISDKPFDMIVIEEAGKLHDGDILSGLALVTGMKDSPVIASPLPIVLVGDEQQLPPHTKVDPNLNAPRLCPAPFFDRYVSKCRKFSENLDINYPLILVTQHRAHRPIADIHSHFAYKGVIQTGARESLQKWNADEMDKLILESNFKFRTVSIVSYRGSIHGDVRGSASEGSNTNRLECDLVVNICEDWFYRSRKFLHRISILSPYKGQVEKIRGTLQKRSTRKEFLGLSTATVHTVDSSQGIESDILIVSLVRTHRSERQAFLDNAYRINVLISRAKERLIIIGARDEICSISLNWDRFYKIVDALAQEEQIKQQNPTTNDDEAVDDQIQPNYGFYDVMSSSSISEPKERYR